LGFFDKKGVFQKGDAFCVSAHDAGPYCLPPFSLASRASRAASMVSVKLTLRPKVFSMLSLSASRMICSLLFLCHYEPCNPGSSIRRPWNATPKPFVMSLGGPIRRLLGEKVGLRIGHFRRQFVHSERRSKLCYMRICEPNIGMP
jgi:hypothetical protein